MTADETERYMNIRADTRYWEGHKGANMSFLYPALYTITCRLNIRYSFFYIQKLNLKIYRYFPYDQQVCNLILYKIFKIKT